MGEDEKLLDEELLAEAEIQQIAKKFLLAKYFDSKIDFTYSQLIMKDDIQIYELRGEITMKSRGSLDPFVVGKSANRYAFKIEINARQGQILSYEFV